MEKIKVQEVVVVEGKYDLNALKQVIDGVVVTTNGFGIFRDQEKMSFIRRLAATKGVVVLTDSDGAGFVIRNHLKSCLPSEQVKHAYIPDVYGKERRKRKGGKEGKLGVEGMSPQIIRKALADAGATVDGAFSAAKPSLSKADLYALGLSGRECSVAYRKKLLSALELPEHLSPNALLDVLNIMFDKESFVRYWNELQNQE